MRGLGLNHMIEASYRLKLCKQPTFDPMLVAKKPLCHYCQSQNIKIWSPQETKRRKKNWCTQNAEFSKTQHKLKKSALWGKMLARF